MVENEGQQKWIRESQDGAGAKTLWRDLKQRGESQLGGESENVRGRAKWKGESQNGHVSARADK